jgi:hypothetical protein
VKFQFLKRRGTTRKKSVSENPLYSVTVRVSVWSA